MSKQPEGALLKAGDHVRIPGEDRSGVVRDAERHRIIVSVLVDGTTKNRWYTRESLVLEPTMDEASGFVDH